jgi:hypothetical protein
MQEYYLEFKTWAEGDIITPWPFVWIEETDDYRKRSSLAAPIDRSIVRGIFLSFNAEKYEKFLSDHVRAVMIAAVVKASGPDQVSNEISKVFGYCEIIGICEVNDQTKDAVNMVMGNAR